MVRQCATAAQQSPVVPLDSQLAKELKTMTSAMPRELPSIARCLSDTAVEELSGTKRSLREVLESLGPSFHIQRDVQGIYTASQPGGSSSAEEQLCARLKEMVPETSYVRLAALMQQLSADEKMLVALHSGLPRFISLFPKEFQLSNHLTHARRKDNAGYAPVFEEDRREMEEQEAKFAMVAETDAMFEATNVAYGSIPPAPAAMPTTYGSLADPSQTVSYDPNAREVMDLMLALLPPYFVPFTELEALLGQFKDPANPLTALAMKHRTTLFDSLEAMSGQDVDIRVLGDQRSDIFVRLIAASFPTSQQEEGSIKFPQFNPLKMSKEVYKAMSMAAGGTG